MRSVQINAKISNSTDFKKLLRLINTPGRNKKGITFTASGTTADTQEIIIQLLGKQLKKGIISSTIKTLNIEKHFESIKIYKTLTFKLLQKYLEANNFTRTEKVSDLGEYTVRGDIITFWPSIYEHPIRINFWGDKIESKEIIDEIYQNKFSNVKEIAIGNEAFLEDELERQSLKLSNTSLPVNINKLIFCTPAQKADVKFDFSYPPLYFNRFDLLIKDISKKKAAGWDVLIQTTHTDKLPENIKQSRRDARSCVSTHSGTISCVSTTKSVPTSGFASPSLKLMILSDRELFGTIFISKEKTKSQKEINKYLAQLEGEVEVDDFIVHEDYGIAIYRGIHQRETLGRFTDYLILEYAEGDKLSVPLSQVHKLTKYIGPDNVPPKITRLGKTSWRRIKQKVKESVAFLAKELLRHYAKSEVAKGDEYHKHEWEERFASDFEFEETVDQKRTINEILHDLSVKKPMNRLLVGDVGFGKTEVAIRAAFRAVMNGKQVIVLCPTTILVSQHYSVFKHRMRNYPIQIATLSRFGSKVENAKIVEQINNGKIDIVIGTHRLLSNDIQLKDLGLLVIDEEQRFGVKQKEKIKKLAYNCNVLSASATPIPRTLSMALSNLRDISIITTPPPGRKSIKTSVDYFSWNKAANVILKEVNRGGQIYFLHNEVRTIESIKAKLEKILPNVRFKVAHGQMHPKTLDKTMREFYEGKFDCLVCTTIIENGIDIKNVNTMIINKAQNFGLAQLYQLRGRVGRSVKQAFCYLFYTQKNIFKDVKLLDYQKGKKKIPFTKAKERLEAILESQELGSGFKIASRDLEIRGAGNLLGHEQHGNISKIGLGLYTQLLADEIDRIRNQYTVNSNQYPLVS